MKIVKAGYEIYPVSDGNNTLKKIEQIARVCYKSEDKITENSYKRMISTLVRNKHTAMLEHGSIIVELDINLYSTLVDRLRFLQGKYGESCRLRYTASGYSGRNLVSGNLRAWLEYLQLSTRHDMYNPVPLLEILLSEKYSPVFEGFTDSRIWRGGECKELFYNDLTDKEKLVHGDISVKFIVDRGVSHEIVRHRESSFAQESTRYCNYGNNGGDVTFIKPCYLDEWSKEYLIWENVCRHTEIGYLDLLKLGRTPQEARAVLDTSLKTEVVMTTTNQWWIHFFMLRALGVTGKPHPQMLEVAVPLLHEMAKLEPVNFGGLVNG